MPNTLVVQDVVCSEAHYKLDTGQLKWWGPNRHIYLTINQMDITDGESRYSTISLKMQQSSINNAGDSEIDFLYLSLRWTEKNLGTVFY